MDHTGMVGTGVGMAADTEGGTGEGSIVDSIVRTLTYISCKNPFFVDSTKNKKYFYLKSPFFPYSAYFF